MYNIEPYTDKYRQELIAVFRMHVPHYFAVHEEQELIRYLDNYAQDFYICKNGEQLIGCGGHNIEKGIGKLSWYFVHPDFQQSGVGRLMAAYNIDALKKKGYSKISVRTSQYADKFYEKLGFRLIRVEKDFWAEGLDLYEMELTGNSATAPVN